MEEKHYTLTELSQITEMSPRTIRFYMSKSLVSKPHGSRKTAFYTQEHLEQLLTVSKWQKEGLTLDAIYEKIQSGDKTQPPRIKPGEVSVMHRIHISEGVELNVDLLKTQLSQTQIRQLANDIYGWLDEAVKVKESEDA